MQNPLSPDIWHQLHQGHKTLTALQERRLLKAARKADPSTRALCELLFHTGCRLSEALALRRDHIDTDHGFVVIHTLKQRGQERLRAVPVPPALLKRLYGIPTGADGRFWPYSRWTARRRLLPIYSEAGLVGTQASTRVFRHSFNARAIRAGLPDRVRCMLLGHQTQSANNHYGAMLGYELRGFTQRLWQSPWFGWLRLGKII